MENSTNYHDNTAFLTSGLNYTQLYSSQTKHFTP